MPVPRAPGDRPSRPMRRGRLLWLVVPLALAAAILAWRFSGVDRKPTGGSTSSDSPPPARPAQRTTRRPTVHLATTGNGALSQPLQDAAAVRVDPAHALVLGGLDSTDTSTDAIRLVGASGDRRLGRLPDALHDSAAVSLGGAVYLFGGGTGSGQLDQIVEIDRSGRTRLAARLPAPSSDLAAATIGKTAYIVGGFTGSRWLDTIVAWRPGADAHVVAHLPSPVRYAAVTAVRSRLVIAGGSL